VSRTSSSSASVADLSNDEDRRRLPQTEVGRDPAVIRDYAQAVEAMGHAFHEPFGWIIREAGRDPAAFGIEARMALATTPVEQRANDIAAWRAMRGITHLCVNTMGLGLPGPEAHVRILERFKKDASDR
jgi:hypothetical protein